MDPFEKRGAIGAVLIVLAVLLAYLPAMEAGFVWDDDSYVTENATLTSLEGLGQIWFKPTATPQYYPLVFTSFWLEHRLWGLDPLGYHLVNVLLHGLGALVLWRILRGLQVPGAWFAALVFALHPVQVESVAWVTERKNVLSGLFYFASFFWLIRFFGLHGRDREGANRGDTENGALTTVQNQPMRDIVRATGNQNTWYWTALVFFICALLSKTVTCSLPAAMVLVLWWKRGRIRARETLVLVPFFALGLGAGLLTAWLERIHVGAQGMDWQLSFLDRCLIAGRALWFYAGKLVWPATLTFNYPRWQVDPASWWQYLYPAGVLFVLALLWRFRRRLGRGPLAGVLFFCGTLFPALGFFDVYPFVYAFVADHFQYLASVGLIAVAVGGLMRGALQLVPWQKGVVAAIGVVIVPALGVQTWRQSHVYKDLETLWTDTLEKNPGSWMAHNNLGNVLANQGKVVEAIGHFQKALRIRPNDEKTHTNLGFALARQGKFQEAKTHYLKALQIKPNTAEAHYCLGLVLAGEGKTEEAVFHFFEALRIKPDYGEAHDNLGVLLSEQGRFEEAVAHFSKAVEMRPDDAPMHFKLGFALGRAGKSDEAIGHLSRAVELASDDAEAHTHLGVALVQQERIQEALPHFAQAVRIAPDSAEAHMNLSQVYWLLGDKKLAMEQYHEVRALDEGVANELLAWMEASGVRSSNTR